ncbi:MAG: PAS domain-containing sensor histidine kinase [Gemmatimonadaceae bacterium]|nr:PAS domain-containing sensor histidine kinase [Gemmatimonadaceae bacterium]
MDPRPPTASRGDELSDDVAVATIAAPEALFASILDIAADAIIVVSSSQHVLHFNQGASQVFGYLPEEMVGRPLSQLMPTRYRGAHGTHVEQFRSSRERARRMGDRREIYGVRKDGTEFPAEASISRLETRHGPIYTVVLRDITERTLRERNERFLSEAGGLLGTSLDVGRTLQALASVPVPYLADACIVDVVGPDGAWQRQVSRTDVPDLQEALDAVGQHTLTWDSPWRVIDAMRAQKAEVVGAVTDDWLEGHTETPADLARWKALNARSALFVPLIARDHVLGALTLVRRNSAPFSAEQVALAQALGQRAAYAMDNARLYTIAQRATRAREDVLSVVSHDLGNPLAAIRLCAAALLEAPPADVMEQRHLMQAIGNSADWMSKLIQDLLDVSTIEVGKLSLERRTEQVGPIVKQAVAMVAPQAQQRGVALHASVDDGVPAVHGDAARLIQVLTNLLGNSLKYTERDGSVTVSAAAQGHEVLLAVRDTGSGIPAEQLPRIFERYYTRKRGANKSGSGLGLAIARGIVEAHGGRIWVESEVGVGTSFFVALPAAH